MVTTSELKVDDVSLLRDNLLRIKPKTNCAVLASTDEDSDIGGRDEGRSESGDDSDRRGDRELHARTLNGLERMKRLRRLVKSMEPKIG